MSKNATFPPIRFRIENGTDTFEISVSGRQRWALEQLIKAGPRGCTPIDTPGPRWSGYVCRLRQADVQIETIHEAHRGAFPGSHARYVLQSTAVPLTSGASK